MTEFAKWWESRQNLVELVYHLEAEGYDVNAICYAVEKPWKYEDNWNEYLAKEKAKRANN